jgi:hypothetical protein
MLISRREGLLQLVSHPDHGRLAGAVCERWGNDQFAVPAPREALLEAATHHDDGWAELDGQPVFNAEAKRPAHFLELSLPDTVGPYGRGVDKVYARSPHAGALVSMHWAGLYSTRWGLQPGGPVPHPVAAEVVADQERRWVAALREAWGYAGPRSEFEAQTWHAYEVLQALDFISLALCLLDTGRPLSGGAPVAMPPTLPHVDQPAGGRIIPSVPQRLGSPHVDVTLWVAESQRVVLDPYPFEAPEFDVEVPVRELPDRQYASAEEAAAAYHDAPVQARRLTIAAVG